jgi:hypothetical protein
MSLELNQKSELAFGPVHFFLGRRVKEVEMGQLTDGNEAAGDRL